MQVEYFIRFQGKCYDVGTRLRFYSSKRTWGIPKSGIIEEFNGTACIIKGDDERTYILSTVAQENGHRCVVEILKPVYYVEKRKNTNRNCPPIWKVENVLIWYIIIMVVGILFKARLLIWIVATVIFFTWATGHFNNKN